MADEGFKRKLAAIFSADAVGYSRLMGEDEEATIRTLTEYREAITAQVKQHKGRVVDSPGDNVLAEFSSVVDAVRCAVQIQKEIAKRNVNLPENRHMPFRIGVNLGDIVEEDDRIYGDGVNIAARLESLAEGGGICISRTSFDQLKGKLEVGYQYLGEHRVKNIEEPVRVYKILMEPEAAGKVIGERRKTKRWMAIAAAVVLLVGLGGLAGWYLYIEQTKRIEPASEERMAFPLPDKPSIAVLPFVNISGDPQQDYFCDGLTEEIITGISKTPKVFVIARNSVFTYKGKPVKVQQVAEELGVRYVLEGSVRKSEGQVRITAQLIDALTGKHLWAERYDRELKDIFSLQDEITLKILSEMQVKLTYGEEALVRAKGTNNLQAYLKSWKAQEYFQRWDPEGSLLARKTAKEIIDLDPNYSSGYFFLGATHYLDVILGVSKSPLLSLKKSEELLLKALSLNPKDSFARGSLSHVNILLRQYEKSISEAKLAIADNPNNADAHGMLGSALYWADKADDAIYSLKKSIRMNPYPPSWVYFTLAMAYRDTGRYEKAIAEGK